MSGSISHRPVPRKGADIDTSGAGSCNSKCHEMSRVHGDSHDSHVMPCVTLVPHIHSERLRVASSHRVDCNCDNLSPLKIPSERWLNLVFTQVEISQTQFLKIAETRVEYGLWLYPSDFSESVSKYFKAFHVSNVLLPRTSFRMPWHSFQAANASGFARFFK